MRVLRRRHCIRNDCCDCCFDLLGLYYRKVLDNWRNHMHELQCRLFPVRDRQGRHQRCHRMLWMRCWNLLRCRRCSLHELRCRKDLCRYCDVVQHLRVRHNVGSRLRILLELPLWFLL